MDTIKIDDFSICTVLEYCENEDLDIRLKKKGHFSEKDARAIMEKLLNVVKYLNEKSEKIIHYDLKPGNILFTKNEEVKVTDFGLCKMMKTD